MDKRLKIKYIYNMKIHNINKKKKKKKKIYFLFERPLQYGDLVEKTN